MSAPFPGMDPYLEGSLWTTFHFALGAGYDLAIDYTQPPDVLLAGEAAFVAENILQAAGLHPA